MIRTRAPEGTWPLCSVSGAVEWTQGPPGWLFEAPPWPAVILDWSWHLRQAFSDDEPFSGQPIDLSGGTAEDIIDEMRRQADLASEPAVYLAHNIPASWAAARRSAFLGSLVCDVGYTPDPIVLKPSALLNILDVPFTFGLRETTRTRVTELLADGVPWPTIAAEVGWEPETLRQYYSGPMSDNAHREPK